MPDEPKVSQGETTKKIVQKLANEVLPNPNANFAPSPTPSTASGKEGKSA